MDEFKDKIPAAGASIEFFYDNQGRSSVQISGTAIRAFYQIAMSLDGRRLLASVPAGGIGAVTVYPQPSILAFIQSDQQGMWGRNCPACEKYFRTTHIMGRTSCPYCAICEPDLAFLSKEQHTYLIAFYDACARSLLQRKNTSLSMSSVTDEVTAWHYSEEKQQFHFKCCYANCDCETDILGRYGYCPRCGKTNARKLFSDDCAASLELFEQTDSTVSDRHKREELWERLTKEAVSQFESLAKHLRRKLLRYPMTERRFDALEKVSFQQIITADSSMKQWFDIGFFEWCGNNEFPAQSIPDVELPFLTKMVQKRHVLIHNGGLVDAEYLEKTGDTQLRLDERIRIRSTEVRRFLGLVRDMGMIFTNNVEATF